MMPRTSRTPARQLMTIQLTFSATPARRGTTPRTMKTIDLRVVAGTID